MQQNLIPREGRRRAGAGGRRHGIRGRVSLGGLKKQGSGENDSNWCGCQGQLVVSFFVLA